MSYLLLSEFIDESESFALGFECGCIYQRIKEGETFEKQLIHKRNVAQIKMLCDVFYVEVFVEDIDNTWSHLTILPLIIK